MDRNTTILLIEDNAEEAYIVMRMLSQIRPTLHLTILTTDAQVLAYLADPFHKKPILILLDLYLPTRQAGLQALSHLQTHFLVNHTPPAPVIILSNSEEAVDIQLCYDLGVNAYMVKPSTRIQLTNFIEYWLKTVTIPT